MFIIWILSTFVALTTIDSFKKSSDLNYQELIFVILSRIWNINSMSITFSVANIYSVVHFWVISLIPFTFFHWKFIEKIADNFSIIWFGKIILTLFTELYAEQKCNTTCISLRKFLLKFHNDLIRLTLKLFFNIDSESAVQFQQETRAHARLLYFTRRM